MEYQYSITESDSFYTNYRFRYHLHDDKIVAIKKIYESDNFINTKFNGFVMNTFNCDTKEFTPIEKLQRVAYDDLKQVTSYEIDLTYMFLIDTENKQYTKTNKFPFMIHEIDGNCIETCRNGNAIYIFHSRTENYETGVFVFDIATNQFNHRDYFDVHRDNAIDISSDDDSSEDMDDLYDRTIKHSNRFKSLHGKTITSCCMYDNNIYILWHDRYDDSIKLSNYDPANDRINFLMTPMQTKTWYKSLIVANNQIFIKPWADPTVSVYDLTSYQLLTTFDIYSEGDTCVEWSIRDNALISITEKYRYPFGQIWTDNHDEEFRTRNMKIIKFNIETIKS